MKKRDVFVKAIAWLCLLPLVCACSVQTANSNGNAVLNSSLSLDFSQTQSLYIAPSGSSTSTATYFLKRLDSLFSTTSFAQVIPDTSVFAQSFSGDLSPVNLTTGGSAFVFGIIDTVNYTALLTAGVVDKSGEACGLVLIRKSNGQTFCIHSEIGPMSPGGFTIANDYFKIVQSNYSGTYIVFLDSSGNVVRLDFTNPASPVETTVVAAPSYGSGELATAFAVNGEGDVLVASTDWDENFYNFGYNNLDLYKVSGAHQNIIQSGPPGGGESYAGTLTSNTAANDNNFYFYGRTATCTDSDYACELVDNSGTFTTQQGSPLTTTMCSPGGGCNLVWVGSTLAIMFAPEPNGYWFFTSNGTLNMNNACEGLSSCQGNAVIPWTGTISGTVYQLDRIGGRSGVIVVESQDASGRLGLYAYNIASQTFSTLMAPGSYSISAFDVDLSGNVTVSGTRQSDGSIIFGVIPAGTTTINVINSSLSGTVNQIANLL